jgi:hypothetical protein
MAPNNRVNKFKENVRPRPTRAASLANAPKKNKNGSYKTGGAAAGSATARNAERATVATKKGKGTTKRASRKQLKAPPAKAAAGGTPSGE